VSPRGRTSREVPQAHLPGGEDEGDVRLDPMLGAADDQLQGWTAQERALFAELLEDAGSELQRELLQRALAMGHLAPELHSFADAIRGMGDAGLYRACTPDRSKVPDVSELLRAQADPLAAFEINGHALKARKPKAPKPLELGRFIPSLPPVDNTFVGIRPKKPSFDAESPGDARRPERPKAAAPASAAPARPGPPGCFAEDLFNAAGEFLPVRFTERAVDVSGGITIEEAVPLLAEALSRGIPVPILLGRFPGEFLRYALILQVQVSGRNRAYQLHDPFAQDTVWANEGDLLARNELPFSDKLYRRITAIALPARSSKGVAAVQSGFEEVR